MKNNLSTYLPPILFMIGVVFGVIIKKDDVPKEELDSKIVISYDLGYSEGYHKATEDLAYLNQFNEGE